MAFPSSPSPETSRLSESSLDLVEVTDADEIASIQRNGLPDIIGGRVDGRWMAYRWSVDRWRKSRPVSA
jgi:hypothetical protein